MSKTIYYDMTREDLNVGTSIAANMPVVVCPFMTRTPHIYTSWHRDRVFGVFFVANQVLKLANDNDLTEEFFA